MQLNDVSSDCAYKGVVHQLHGVWNSCGTAVLLREHAVTASSHITRLPSLSSLPHVREVCTPPTSTGHLPAISEICIRSFQTG